MRLPKRHAFQRIFLEIEEADPLTRVNLIQERMDLQGELDSMTETVDLAALEDEFVEAALSYSERKGITYAAWRELGIEASVLKRAGIRRGAS